MRKNDLDEVSDADYSVPMTFDNPRTRAGSSKSMQAVRVNPNALLPAEWVPVPLVPVVRHDATERMRAAEYMLSAQIELDS